MKFHSARTRRQVAATGVDRLGAGGFGRASASRETTTPIASAEYGLWEMSAGTMREIARDEAPLRKLYIATS